MARRRIKNNKALSESMEVKNSTAIYIRVSTEKQAEEGYSIDAQQTKLLAYCAAKDWAVDSNHIFIDAGISGKTEDREQFQTMLDSVTNGDVKRIVAIKLDRIARNVRMFLQVVDDLNKIGCELVLIQESFDTSTPTGKFALTMFAAMAELEAKQITDRVMTGKAQKALESGFNGGKIPYGYVYTNSSFNVVPEQSETVERIFTLFNAGNSCNSIATTLNNEEIRSPKGQKWYNHTVSYLLNNGAYCGLTQWNGSEVDGNTYPTIITKEVYEVAHNRLQTLTKGNPNFTKAKV